jgi:hypothetical protein
MKKEISKNIKETLPQVMEKYGGVFSIELGGMSGFAHLKFINNDLHVTFLNDEGMVQEEGIDIPYTDIERVANFMREMKELRLSEYQK